MMSMFLCNKILKNCLKSRNFYLIFIKYFYMLQISAYATLLFLIQNMFVDF